MEKREDYWWRESTLGEDVDVKVGTYLRANHQEYQEIRYNKLLANVLKGVDTYWLSEPLRTGLNQRHFISAQGGNEQLRYSLGVSYNKIDGVMKKSGRDILSGNIDVL